MPAISAPISPSLSATPPRSASAAASSSWLIAAISPIYYSTGAVIISGSFDPINDLGLAGWHQWKVYVYPDGQGYPIESPLQAA